MVATAVATNAAIDEARAAVVAALVEMYVLLQAVSVYGIAPLEHMTEGWAKLEIKQTAPAGFKGAVAQQ